MAKKKVKRAYTVMPEDIQVQFVPVVLDSIEYKKRMAEVDEIVTKIIMLGKTRGRPMKNHEEDILDAA